MAIRAIIKLYSTPELNGKVERFNRSIKKAMQNRL